MPTLTTNAQFLRYAEDEYFSECMLRSMKPKPGKTTPKSVVFEWGQVTSGGKMQMYMLKATGVTEWSLEGEWEKHAVVEFDLPRTRKGISLTMKVPGMLRLKCAKISAVRGPEKRYSVPAAIDPEHFLVWGDKAVTWNQLRDWLGIPAGYAHFDQTGSKLTRLDHNKFDETIVCPYYVPTRIQNTPKDIGTPWMFVMWMLGIGRTGHYFSVYRGTCDDAAWTRAVRLPEHIGPSNVMSGSIKCSSKTWLEKWAGKAATAKATERSA